MLGESRISKISEAVLARSTADQTEVVVLAGDSYLTRFANSAIHQNVAETDTEVRIRVVLGQRVGVAVTNRLEDEDLDEALHRALTVARLQPENPEFQSLPGPQPIPEVKGFSESTAGCTPAQRAQGVATICEMARAAGLVASGAFKTATLELGVANSLGTSAYYPMTYADINTVVMCDTSAGYASALVMDVGDLDFEALARQAVETCVRSQNPRSLPAGEYPVILEPYAVQDLVQMLAWTGLGAVGFQEGRSFMVGKIGQQIVDPRISLWDDGLDPAGLPWPFDFEGVPKQRVDFIKAGVARGVVYDSYRAGKEEGKASTGHALPAPNAFGPIPTNLFLAPGEATLEEMIASTGRGVYITRFWYTRPVEPARVVITGMTRDGTFLVENGEIAYPVKNLRFTQSYLESFNQINMVGRDRKLLLGLADIARDCIPALKLDRFTFTGATEF